MKNLSVHFFLIASLLIASVFMQGCVEQKVPSGPQEGQLVDSPVEGIPYTTETQSGITGSGGTFNYLPGETVQFKLGNIVFPPVPADKIITPLDMANTAFTSNEKAVAIGQILQSFDTDGDPSNGIFIDQAGRTAAYGLAIDIAQDELAPNSESENQLELVLISIGLQLVEKEVAKGHIEETIIDLMTGVRFKRAIEDGPEETFTRGAGYLSSSLIGTCVPYTVWIYGVFPLTIDFCYTDDGEGTITINQVRSDMTWSVNEDSGVSVAVDGPLDGVTNVRINRLEDGTPLVEFDRLPIDIVGLPDLLTMNTLMTFLDL